MGEWGISGNRKHPALFIQEIWHRIPTSQLTFDQELFFQPCLFPINAYFNYCYNKSSYQYIPHYFDQIQDKGHSKSVKNIQLKEEFIAIWCSSFKAL